MIFFDIFEYIFSFLHTTGQFLDTSNFFSIPRTISRFLEL
uniref:Uncharacterized protein n=1 Tax=viral metagenome TaxID=1070528 RepID=A0A6C0D3D7_9ZZZZ